MSFQKPDFTALAPESNSSEFKLSLSSDHKNTTREFGLLNLLVAHPSGRQQLMKASLIFILLLSLTAVARPERKRISTFDVNLSPAGANWPEDALVNVYFVRDMFSASERQTLREAMESWTKRGGTGISFVFAGETGGLIDCERCLTIARQGVSANGRVQRGQRVIINPIRQDHAGRLISAWITFERSAVNSAALRTLMLEALARGFGLYDSQTARNTRR